MGQKAKKYSYPDVTYPDTGEKPEFVEGTKPKYPPDHTIAGDGCRAGNKIKDIERLKTQYKVTAGTPQKWKKEKARYEVYDDYGEIREIEIHWYQHPYTGQVEHKIKMQGGTPFVDEWEEW